MGCLDCLLTTVVRIVLLPLCLIFLVFGAVLLWFTLDFNYFKELAIEKLQGETPEHILPADQMRDELTEFSEKTLNQGISYTRIFFLVGTFFFLLGTAGIIALFVRNLWFRGLYELVVGGILGLLIYSANVNTQDMVTTASSLKSTLNEFQGFKGNNSASRIWNLIHVKLHCCGVNGYEDFQNLQYWPPDDMLILGLETPISCCKKIDVSDITCAQNGTATKENNWLDKGCISSLFDGDMAYGLHLCSILLAATLFIGIGLLVLVDDQSEDERRYSRTDQRRSSTYV